KPMDRTGVLLSFYDNTTKPVLSVSQWSDRVLIRTGADIKTGSKASLVINRKSLLTVTAGRGGIRLYVDGKISGGSTQPFYGLEKVTGFTLGNSPEGKYFWKGSFQHLAIWTRALSDDEVRANSEAALAQAKPDFHGLAGLYIFDGRGPLVRNAVSGEMDIHIPENFSPVKKIFLGPLFEKDERVRLDHVDAAVNFFGFIPLGLLAFLLMQADRRCCLNLIFAVAAGFALSLAIEAAQVFLPDRFSQATDLLLNTSGALAGAMFALFFKTTLRRLIN
ncbi:MAG: VanZ family protein, partial [Deltaproteobacteria bacterium]|nr:VanZ family protein [Deltaproteobacteria bacterium]